jgi:hypothetical protein
MRAWWMILVAAVTVHAQVPDEGRIAWWRADRGVEVADDGRVTSWTSTDTDPCVAIASDAARPQRIAQAINGNPAIRFDGTSTYLDGPERFPVGRDYVLYVVARVQALPGANNIISGNRRALWLNGADRPRVLHAADFGKQAVSDIGIGTGSFAVVRIAYLHAQTSVTIHVNNALGTGPTLVPANDDPEIFLGSYARGNVLHGDIAEVLLYDRMLDDREIRTVDSVLHARYAIARVPDPEPPTVIFDRAPKPMELVAVGDSLICAGTVIDPAVVRVTMEIDSQDVGRRFVFEWNRGAASSVSFSFASALIPGLHAYHVRVLTSTPAGRVDTILVAPDVVCGEVFAIEGQSNSIWPDPTLQVTPWARTFGSNFGQSASDTSFRQSIATGAAGDANVGAWGLYLQRRIADEFRLPTCVINGGVGGTRIEAHYPNATDREALTTIYGSWLYRLRTSRLASHVRWLFWYQGESNAGTDRYGELFDNMYRAWHEDLPNLERIIVIQIRPGCGGAAHARLRDDQRRLEERYPDVYVHAAAGLPGHDGCHYQPIGYQTLGEQLFSIWKLARLGMGPGFPGSAPRIERAELVDGGPDTRSVHLIIRRGAGLHMTPDTMVGGTMRRATDAFFVDGNETRHPQSVRVVGDTVILGIDGASSPTTVSYVPDRTYDGSDVVYQGPWLVSGSGVGALTFHAVPCTVVSVANDPGKGAGNMLSVRAGRSLATMPQALSARIIDLRGSVVATMECHDGRCIVPALPPGPYAVDDGRVRMVMVLP